MDDPSQGFDLQQAAYFMWEADGRPPAGAERYWNAAVAMEAMRRERAAADALTSVEEKPSAHQLSMKQEQATADDPMVVQEPASVEADTAREHESDQPLDPSFGWFDLARAQAACGITGLSRLTACRTFGDIAVSQNALLHQSFQLTVEHGLRMVERVHAAIEHGHPEPP